MSAEKFLDTNVLFYSCDSSDARKHTIALDLVQKLSNDANAIVSTQVLGEFFNATVIRKKLLIAAEAQKIIEGYCQTFEVAGIDVELVRSAMKIHQKYQTSYWDSLIIATAAKHGCREILSEDLSAGQKYEGVVVVNPF